MKNISTQMLTLLGAVVFSANSQANPSLHSHHKTVLTAEQTMVLSVAEDTFVASNYASTNYNGSQLSADGSDKNYGQTKSLLKWDMNKVPKCAQIQSATIVVDVDNVSRGRYNIYSSHSQWHEQDATWQSVDTNTDNLEPIARFRPRMKSLMEIVLSSRGVKAVQQWLGGNNNGVVIASDGTRDGIGIKAKENGYSPKLVVRYKGCEMI